MPCYHPIDGWYSKTVNPSGKRSIVFKAEQGGAQKVTIACQRCIGCRLERSRQWAMRCMHEAQLHDENSFITLTYDDQHLPYGGTLIKKHFQDFMKRLRRHFGGRKIQYYHCGEYGERTRRPHYHALLFGLDFRDKLHFKTTARGDRVFTSSTLSKLWGMGHCSIGAVTFESAAYTARYILKKQSGDQAESHYRKVMADTGEVVNLLPEYVTMSLKPTVGRGWIEEFSGDVYPDDFVVMRGKKMKPPKYYDRMHELEDP